MKPQLRFFLFLLSFTACSQSERNTYHNVDDKVFSEQMKNEHTVILDVRTPEEYKAGHIPHAVPMNFYDPDFAKKAEALDKNQTYLVYCASGGRSAKASVMMAEKGIKEIYNLEGGYNHWSGEKVK